MSLCKCSQYPFKPDSPCRNICTGKALSSATRYELSSIFHISQNLADKIARINIENQISNFDDYRDQLNWEDFKELGIIFSNLNENQEAIHWLKNKFGPEDDKSGILRGGGEPGGVVEPGEVIKPEEVEERNEVKVSDEVSA